MRRRIPRRIPWHRVPRPIRFRYKTTWLGLRERLLPGPFYQRDALAVAMLESLPGPYVPWTTYALRPDAVVAALNAVVLLDAETVVECGAGVSTIYAARLLRQRGRGHLHTIEENPRWAKVIVDQLEREETSSHVTMHVSPLRETRWYDPADLEPLRAERVQVLVVDGPATPERWLARPFFRPLLADDYVVILDDIWEPWAERDLRAWEDELGVRARRRYLQGSIGILRPATSRLDMTFY